MDFVSPLYNTLQAGAQLGLTQAQAADTQAIAQTRLYGLMQNIQTQQMMRDYFARQQQGQQGGQPVSSSGPANNTGPGSGLYPGDQSPWGYGGVLGPAAQEVGLLQRQAAQWSDLGNFVSMTNPEEGRKWLDMAAKAREQVSQKSLELVQRANDMDKHVGGLAGAAAEAASSGNQAAMMGNIRQMAAMQPALIPQFQQLELDENGIPRTSPANAAALANIANSKMTRAEQTNEGLRVATIQNTEAYRTSELANQQTRLAIEQQTADQRAAANRASLQMREENLYQRQVGQAQQISSAYENQSKDFKEMVPRMQAATSYLIDPQASAQAGKPVLKPNSAFNPAADRMFGEAYIKLIYPEFKGSVYDQKALDQLPGIPVKILQGIKNALSGKEIDRDTKADMYGAMQLAFKPMNEMQIQREDSAAQKAVSVGIPAALSDIYVNKYALRPSQQQAPAPAPAAAGNSQTGAKYQEGQTATGPGGKKVIFRNGQWQPM